MQSALTNLAGVESAKIDLKSGDVLVRFRAEQVKPVEMAKVVTDAGFKSEVKHIPEIER